MSARGTVAPGFEPVRELLDGFLAADPGFSAQLSARHRGAMIVDLVGGNDLEADSLTGVFSSSKGIAAVALATLIDDGRLDLDTRVTDYWPEFGAHGKAEVLVRELLSHQVGLLNTEIPLTAEDFQQSARAAEKLANSLPVWRPTSTFGYHALTIGVFIEELVRRVTAESLQSLYEREIRAPRSIDFYLGLPETQEHRFRPVLPMDPTPDQQAELDAAPASTDGLLAFAFNSLHIGGIAVPEILPNSRSGRQAGVASVGGIGSARGIADVYAAALGHLGGALLSPETIARVSQEQVSGIDRVLSVQMAFATVFMKPQPRIDFGSYRAFGHDGAGGALGFADPLYDLAFGYVPMPMQFPGGADVRGVALSAELRRCILRS